MAQPSRMDLSVSSQRCGEQEQAAQQCVHSHEGKCYTTRKVLTDKAHDEDQSLQDGTGEREDNVPAVRTEKHADRSDQKFGLPLRSGLPSPPSFDQGSFREVANAHTKQWLRITAKLGPWHTLH